MKVFQVIKCVGCYEDYHEHVVGTYLHKEKAERELAKLKANVPDCDECPYSKEYQDQPIKTDCHSHKPKKVFYGEYRSEDTYTEIPAYTCENCIDSYDAPSYKMNEYEVDESEE